MCGRYGFIHSPAELQQEWGRLHVTGITHPVITALQVRCTPSCARPRISAWSWYPCAGDLCPAGVPVPTSGRSMRGPRRWPPNRCFGKLFAQGGHWCRRTGILSGPLSPKTLLKSIPCSSGRKIIVFWRLPGYGTSIPQQKVRPRKPSRSSLYPPYPRIAVGMPITGHPPHRSRRARFAHRAPTLGV